MFVGVARIVLQIPGARSLKDRRRVVKSLKDRMRAKLPVSIAEIGDLERYQVATLGVATISNESARCSEVLSHAASLAGSAHDALVADVATEIVSFGSGGSGIRGGIEQALDRGAFSEDSFDFSEDDDG
ncbi:MAG TPA: DUF503 domain-containing protein [Polyangiaceae bacterium]|jgi:hypothetical protein